MVLKYLPYYQILKEHGRGSYGTVYEAIDTRIGKRVAIKCLHEQFINLEEIRLSLIREANDYLYLSHPNIVSLVDLILYPDAVYMVMEFVDGLTLSEYILFNRLTSKNIYYKNLHHIFNQVLSAIGYAHFNTKLHLDIKPSNILITGDLKVKVVDFGISKSFNENIPNKRIGTPLYMSPEQVAMMELNRSTDIYNLGMSMVESYNFGHPYKGPLTEKELFSWIMNEVPHKNISKTIPQKIISVIEKATEKENHKRYLSCEEFSYYFNKAS
jgi:eukaryotic-like serine/threonine-protein kinase